MYFAALFVSFLLTITVCASTTYKDRYLPGHVERTIFNVDWLGCLQACHDEPNCISYNYCKENKSCEINSNGIKDQCGDKPTVISRGWIFHQIRPVPEKHILPEFGDDPSTAAESCEEIFTKRSNVSSRAYYIKTIGGTSFIYCKMETTDECGKGGWTLTMKIDGNKTTFGYDSPLWINAESHNEPGGRDLSNTETKFAVFGSIYLNEGFCVGMNVNGDTKWLKIKVSKKTTATGLFNDPLEPLHIGRSNWKSLINGSYMPSHCSSDKEGFNVKFDYANGARARIGMTGHGENHCNAAAVSRIGFGTDGSAGGMDTYNSCGNEGFDASAGVNVSIKAFCYIFIK